MWDTLRPRGLGFRVPCPQTNVETPKGLSRIDFLRIGPVWSSIFSGEGKS